MILVAGGQLDPNIGRLLRRMIERRSKFVDILIGPGLIPNLTIDLRADMLLLNGRRIRPSACFMRHDVFLSQSAGTPDAEAISINWYYAIKGWELAHPGVKGFNKSSFARENNKVENLYLAKRLGLAVPDTLITNDFTRVRKALRGPLIQKPVAGGEHTTTFESFYRKSAGPKGLGTSPRFFQPRLLRPELRVYRIGDRLFAFALRSKDVDYREHQRVKLSLAKAPKSLERKLVMLCDELGLEFAAADFMRDRRTGEYRFLEVNSQPMFAAFDLVADGGISDAIIDFLS